MVSLFINLSRFICNVRDSSITILPLTWLVSSPPPPPPLSLFPLRTFTIFSNPKSQTIHLDRLIQICLKIYNIPNLIKYHETNPSSSSSPHDPSSASALPSHPTSTSTTTTPSSSTNYHAVIKIITEFEKLCCETNQMEVNFDKFYQVLHHHSSFLLPIFELQRIMRKKVHLLLLLLLLRLLLVWLVLLLLLVQYLGVVVYHFSDILSGFWWELLG